MLPENKAHLFWEKVDQRGDDQCWLRTAATDSSGYGRFDVGRKLDAAHRVSFEMFAGTIPEGDVIDHTCRVRLCVNPRHLRAVDRLTNVHENSASVTHLNSLKEHCPQGHAYEGDNLIVHASGRRRCRACTNQQQRDRRARAGDAR